MNTGDTFSQRYKHFRPAPISIRDDAPASLRRFVLSAVRHFLPYDIQAFKLVYMALGKVPPDVDSARWNRIRDAIDAAPWFKVYDVVEQFYSRSGIERPELDDYVTLTNTFFEENGYAYRLVRGKLEYRGEESFELAVMTADAALTDAGVSTAREEIHKALEDLSKRPKPDLSGAVQHAMAGLECVANYVASTSGLELGKVVKNRPDLFPPPLNEVLPKLYGYASNNGRHLSEGGEPDFAEAELLVGTAAIVATYLARKL
jgi:AbiJ N-terminal domain 4